MENLHVLDEVVSSGRAANILHTSKADLRDDSTELATRSRDTVASGTVTRGEDLTGDDEGRRVRTEVLEEVGETVEEDERIGRGAVRGKLVVSETHDDEQYGKNGETHKLNRLATPRVDKQEADPVSGDKTSGRQNHVTNANVKQVLVDLASSSE